MHIGILVRMKKGICNSKSDFLELAEDIINRNCYSDNRESYNIKISIDRLFDEYIIPFIGDIFGDIDTAGRALLLLNSPETVGDNWMFYLVEDYFEGLVYASENGLLFDIDANNMVAIYFDGYPEYMWDYCDGPIDECIDGSNISSDYGENLPLEKLGQLEYSYYIDVHSEDDYDIKYDTCGIDNFYNTDDFYALFSCHI